MKHRRSDTAVMTPAVRLAPPEPIRFICRTLEQAGHEAWCVGGAVRDAFLGIDTQDWDVATSARPREVQALFHRTIPVGIEFGTVGVLDRHGTLHEVTTFRQDVETDGRHAVVRFGASLDEDLARRDFTINAIAVHAETLRVRDPFGGRADLARRVIRAVGDPRERMREDRLRALRAMRFAGRFDFDIEPQTWDAIVESAPHLGRLSMERVKQELEKIMDQVERPSGTMERYRQAGVLKALIPQLHDVPAVRFQTLDHLARPGLGRRPQRRLLRLAALFIEPGKAPSRTLAKELNALKFSNIEARATIALAEAAADLAFRQLVWEVDDVTLRRNLARIGRLMLPGLARVICARARAEGLEWNSAVLYRRALRIAWRDPLSVTDLAVDGEDLIKAGVPAGKGMGKVLASLLAWVIEDPSRNTRERLLEEVARLA